jgi:hypothetical protein
MTWTLAKGLSTVYVHWDHKGPTHYLLIKYSLSLFLKNQKVIWLLLLHYWAYV